MAGLVAIPVWSHDSAPWPAGAYYGDFASEHSDDAPFGDGSPYATPSIEVLLVDALEIGDTVATIEIVANIDELTGVRWSFEHALYENGPAIAIDGNQWTVEIQPAIRAPIPAGASLNVSRPTCLCRLATDREMDTSFTAGFFDRVDVAFVEAVDEWSNRAAAAAGS
jgi:hypothetical protein